MSLEDLIIDGLKYRKVCVCQKQPCLICFCLFTLYLREINELLNHN